MCGGGGGPRDATTVSGNGNMVKSCHASIQTTRNSDNAHNPRFENCLSLLMSDSSVARSDSIRLHSGKLANAGWWLSTSYGFIADYRLCSIEYSLHMQAVLINHDLAKESFFRNTLGCYLRAAKLLVEVVYGICNP